MPGPTRIARRLLLGAAAVTAIAGAAPGEDARFLAAARADDAATLEAMLAAGQPVDTRDESGRTALLVGTVANAVAAAKVLIAAGADVNAKDQQQDTPFLYAGAEGRTEILALTLAHGANLRDTNRYGGTALIPAAEKGHLDALKLLLATDIDVDHVNRLGWTALLEAVLLSDGGPVHQAIVAALIRAGADPNIADHDGVTALQHARSKGFAEIAALLVAAGAK